MQRLSKSKGDRKATLVDSGSRVLHLDIDKLSVPIGYGWDDPGRLAFKTWTEICSNVPAFKNVSIYWQASSSAGLPATAGFAKFHFWILLDKPIKACHRKKILELAGADKSLASISQPNYTAAPIFDGVANPLEGFPRSGVIHGASEFVNVNKIELHSALQEKVYTKKEALQFENPSFGKTSVLSNSHAEPSALLKACAAISNAEERNNEINKQSYYIGGLVAGGQLNRDVAYQALLAVAAATGHDRYEEAVANGFGAGLHNPIQQHGRRVIKPYYLSPTLPRDHAIHMHGETIRNWAARSIAFMRPVVQARRQVPLPGGRTLSNAFDRQVVPRVMLTGAQGVGKTAALVGRKGRPGALHDTRGMISIVFLPTHRKAAEAALDYKNNSASSSPSHYVLRGRGAEDPEALGNHKMCRANELAAAIVKSGLSVRNVLCPDCPFQHQCGYQRQERELKALASADEGAVLFAAHDYAFVPLPGNIEPDLTIFDERPRDFGVEEHFVSVPELRQATLPGSHSCEDLSQTGGSTAMRCTVQPILHKLADAAMDSPNELLGALRNAGITSEILNKTAVSLNRFSNERHMSKIQDTLALSQGLLEKKASIADLPTDEMGAIRRIRILLQVLAADMTSGQRSSTGVTVRFSSDSSTAEGDQRFHICRLKQLRCGKDKPFLHLDGTGDILVGRSLFGEDLIHHHYPVERNAKVTQVTGRSFSKQSICGFRNSGRHDGCSEDGKAVEFRSALKKNIAQMPEAAVIGSKEVISALGLEGDARACHFGALRGLNSFEGFAKIMIIGREQPASVDIDRIARAFASAKGQPYQVGDYLTEDRTLRGASSSESIGVLRHPDIWGDRILKQVREAEIEQAVDRIRLIHNEHPKEVYLLSPVVLDITVDRIVKWIHFRVGGTRIEKAVQCVSFIPLSSRECGRLLPDLWKNPETAGADLRDAGLEKGMALHDFKGQIPGTRQICHISYRREVSAGERSREYEGLAFVPPEAVKGTVEALTGPLRELRLLSCVDQLET